MKRVAAHIVLLLLLCLEAEATEGSSCSCSSEPNIWAELNNLRDKLYDLGKTVEGHKVELKHMEKHMEPAMLVKQPEIDKAGICAHAKILCRSSSTLD